MNPYQVLGIATSASLKEAEVAYRRMRTRAHPDHGGTAEQFRQVQEAWALIQAGWKPPTTKQSSFWQQTSAKTQPQKPQPKPQPQQSSKPVIQDLEAWRSAPNEYVVHLSISQAFAGFVVIIPHDGKRVRLRMPAGIPHNLRVAVVVNGKPTGYYLTVRFLQSGYSFIDSAKAIRDEQLIDGVRHSVLKTGQLTTKIFVNPRQKTYDELINIDGTRLKVSSKYPYGGFEDGEKIVIPNAGYYDWSSTTASKVRRGDLIVSVSVINGVPMNTFS